MWRIRAHRYNDIEPPAETSKAVINHNMDIIQAKADRYGVLQRPDNWGDNQNEQIKISPEPKKKEAEPEKEPEQTNKFLPGERLLLTIQKEKPELLKQAPEYKQIPNKKRDKLKGILKKIN